MGCGCFPDVRGMLDQALFDPDELRRTIDEWGGGEHATITVLDPPPPLPFKADIEEAIAAGRLVPAEEGAAGTLAVYLDEERRIILTGLVDGQGLVTSRWAGGLVCRHGVFDLPRSHGEMVRYYRPVERDDAKRLTH